MLTQRSKKIVAAPMEAAPKDGGSAHSLVIICDQQLSGACATLSPQASGDAKAALPSVSLVKPYAGSKLLTFFSVSSSTSFSQPKGAPSVSHQHEVKSVESDLVCADIKAVAATSPAPCSTVVVAPPLRLAQSPVPECVDEKPNVVKTLDVVDPMGVIDDSDEDIPGILEVLTWLFVIFYVWLGIALLCSVGLQTFMNIHVPSFLNLEWILTSSLSDWKALPLRTQEIRMPFMSTVANAKLLRYILDMQSRLAGLTDFIVNCPKEVVQRVVLESSWYDAIPNISFLLVLWCVQKCQSGVYLIDFCVYESPEENKCASDEEMIDFCDAVEGTKFTPESIDFMRRLTARTGTGPRCATTKKLLAGSFKNKTEVAKESFSTMVFDCVDRLLRQTGTKAKDVGILVVNCSIFCPTPSLAAMVIDHFGMRSDVSSYNLGGMGCSAGLVSVELAKNALMGKPNSKALVISTEIMSALYPGNDRSFLVGNTLFKDGASAVLLSNSMWDYFFNAKFMLSNLVRTHHVAEGSLDCIQSGEDAEYLSGVRLSKDIPKIAGKAMEKNFTALGPQILPYSELFKVVYSMGARAVQKVVDPALNFSAKVSPYTPDFKTAVDHFCIHAGGRAVVDGIQKSLNLSNKQTEPSRHALYSYGNTSSSSIWYEMDYIRDQMDLKAGQRVLQIGFGSGFKCNTAVWTCLRHSGNTYKKEKYVQLEDR